MGTKSPVSSLKICCIRRMTGFQQELFDLLLQSILTVGVSRGGGTLHAIVCTWGSEDNFMGSFLSSYFTLVWGAKLRLSGMCGRCFSTDLRAVSPFLSYLLIIIFINVISIYFQMLNVIIFHA